jgi:signal peptidase II
MLRMFSQTGLRWLWLTVTVMALDRISKAMIVHYFGYHETLRMTSFFNLTLAYNTGAAFSFLNSAGGWQLWLFAIIAAIVSVGLLIWLQRLKYQQRWPSIAVSLILAGALGNLWDRINYNHVVDFIQLHAGDFYWPVFNVADSAICLGAFMLMLESLIFRKKK